MIIMFETSSPPINKPFVFRGKIGKGKTYRFGFLWFAIAIITKHDYFSYHKYIESGKASAYRKSTY